MRLTDEVLLAWKRGEVTGDEALRRTMAEWRTVARGLWRRYGSRLPTWATFEDVLQVVLLNVPQLVDRYVDLGPGSSITRFVASQAMFRAEKAIHRWRNARQSGPCGGKRGVNPRVEPSCFEMPVDVASDRDDGAGGWANSPAISVPATQEDDVASSEFFRRVIDAVSDLRVIIALMALRRTRGDQGMAAKILWLNPRARLYCGLGSERGARRLVRQAVVEVSQLVAA